MSSILVPAFYLQKLYLDLFCTILIKIRILSFSRLKSISHTWITKSTIVPQDPYVKLRTDSRSYILPSHRFENPDRTILFLGGSTTECKAVKEELRFPALVSTYLEQRGMKVNTLNLGVSGNTVHDSINSFINHAVKDRPDMAIIMHAVNDTGLLLRTKSYDSRMVTPLNLSILKKWAVSRLSSASSFIAAFRYLSAYLKGMGIEKGQFHREDKDFPEDEFRSRLKGFIGLLRGFEVDPVLMTQPSARFRTPLTPKWLTYGAQDRANKIIREVAESENVLLIDLVEEVRKREPEYDLPMKVFHDGLHVIDSGSILYAEIISEILSEYLM